MNGAELFRSRKITRADVTWPRELRRRGFESKTKEQTSHGSPEKILEHEDENAYFAVAGIIRNKRYSVCEGVL